MEDPVMKKSRGGMKRGQEDQRISHQFVSSLHRTGERPVGGPW